ncbi:glycosyltransferase family 2 protein [Thalassovita mangrovi]|uniref:Glycosyltransferase n=1 Tax=Thalassovita mangrovi TaxID=2692236 RepID=A0A6L8LJN4_9RHOB|nr:glycosyltransferase [Thalassovita mangrovi]MYM54710.1 glycosyltransferase [Thalassovita mangrovi]
MYVAERIDFRERPRNFGQFLLDWGILSASQLLTAHGEMALADASLCDVLVSSGVLTADDAYRLQADWLDLDYFEDCHLLCDPDVLNRFDPRLCLKHAALPLRMQDGHLLIATGRPDPVTTADLGLPGPARDARFVLAPEPAIQARLAAHFRADLTRAAATRVPAAESCRNWGRNGGTRIMLTMLALTVLAALVLLFPKPMFTALMLWACLTLAIAATMKSISFLSFLTRPAPRAPGPPHPATPWKRPKVSILVPLFKEREVAQVLVKRLQRLTYPKSLLDVVLILEETDTLTRAALDGADLPGWMRIVIVPDGQPRTKPRAMNYALDFCRGDIIGIYDAEDAPDPDQIDRVAERFAQAPDDLVCLQGVLDYYNAGQNWLARCFTTEYATWFRVMMPGMARLGFAIPLGGTTLFFRRDVLERLGGWDAHNVTEDADLGFRLARHGYRTEMLPTTTGEEANCRVLPWIKQRSRWLKGYMVTYLVHMRSPLVLLRQMGPWKFIGFQLHFVTALSQFLLAPLLWSCWLIVFGLPHPLTDLGSPALIRGLSVLFFGVEICTMIFATRAVAGREHRHLLPWVPTLHFYFPLGVFAAYKALFELVFQPFYWDKTKHGLSL